MLLACSNYRYVGQMLAIQQERLCLNHATWYDPKWRETTNTIFSLELYSKNKLLFLSRLQCKFGAAFWVKHNNIYLKIFYQISEQTLAYRLIYESIMSLALTDNNLCDKFIKLIKNFNMGLFESAARRKQTFLIQHSFRVKTC